MFLAITESKKIVMGEGDEDVYKRQIEFNTKRNFAPTSYLKK